MRSFAPLLQNQLQVGVALPRRQLRRQKRAGDEKQLTFVDLSLAQILAKCNTFSTEMGLLCQYKVTPYIAGPQARSIMEVVMSGPAGRWSAERDPRRHIIADISLVCTCIVCCVPRAFMF